VKIGPTLEGQPRQNLNLSFLLGLENSVFSIENLLTVRIQHWLNRDIFSDFFKTSTSTGLYLEYKPVLRAPRHRVEHGREFECSSSESSSSAVISTLPPCVLCCCHLPMRAAFCR